MDAFYASIEQRDFPQYCGKPLAVGYGGERGVIAAASYEARRYGVRSAMPSKTALKKCPHLLFVPSRFDAYRSVSRQIMDIFLEYTDKVEPLSLDEAFLDVTVNHKQMRSATFIAREIKQRIKAETRLTASAGVSINKFLAKIASDYRKPDGLFVIIDKEAATFVEALEIEKFYGVGKVTAEKMHSLGIYTGRDLKKYSVAELTGYFGKAGLSYYQYARAIDDREVNPNRIRKSVGGENTFLTDLAEMNEILPELRDIAETVWERVKSKDFAGRTITLKIKYSDFEQITRSKTLLEVVSGFDLLWEVAKELIAQVDRGEKKIRLLGLTVSNNDLPAREFNLQLRIQFPEWDK